MPLTATSPNSGKWLREHGPEQLELLFRAIVYYPSAPILIADDQRQSRAASSGAVKLLGRPREKIVGRSLDEFVEPSFKPRISELWQAFLHRGEQQGTIPLLNPNGPPREVEYTAKGNILPVRHLLLLQDKGAHPAGKSPGEWAGAIPPWVKDYALFLLSEQGHIVAWYAGAARMYGYPESEAIDQPVALLYPWQDTVPARVQEELNRSAIEGHFGSECWCKKKDGTRFWANVMTMALKDADGTLQGFARVVRDFSERHERD